MKTAKILFIYILGVTLGLLNSEVKAEVKSSDANNIIESLEDQDKMGPWILITDQENVKIYRSYSSCSGEMKVLLKVQNNNSYNVKIDFDSAFNLSGEIMKIDLPVELTVNAESTLGGDCSTSYSVNPYNYVTTIQVGVCDYIIENLKIVTL